MQIKTIFTALILLIFISFCSCSVSKSTTANQNTAPLSEKQLVKERKKQEKLAEKGKKAAHKRYWSMQTKAAKSRVKSTRKRNKLAAKSRAANARR